MNFDKIKPYLPYAYVIMSAVGGVIVLILAILNEFAVSKAFLFIASVLIFLFSGLTYVYIFVLGERNRNYFLTDTLTGKNMRISDLTFSRVNERMNFFISKRVQAESELWLDGFLGKRGLFGRNDVFKPLAVYKMLFDLGVKNQESGWKLFFAMPDADFSRMINGLDNAGDVKMSRRLTEIRSVTDGTQTKLLAECLTRNNKYIQNRMLLYVKMHISEFNENRN
ncbi:MAG: hypothetical protein J5894_01135 [Clostridia bacterium]|nr:hypothetical protein [Clostridia bacterium]